jgi:TatD DNase family protein
MCIHIYIFLTLIRTEKRKLKKIKKAGIGTIAIGTDIKSSKECVKLAKDHDNIFACVGQHPGDLKEDSVFDEHLRKLAEDKKVVAIGECGLDYFRLQPERSEGINSSEAPASAELKLIQKTVFEYHVDLALELNKPLMLHIRDKKDSQDAYLDALQILEHHFKISGGELKGNVHFFAGDKDVLQRFVNMGFSVSFTGVITFTGDYDELVQLTPLDLLLAETDSPFVAPAPHRGKRNSPLYVPLVVEKIAMLKGESVETIKKALFDNTLKHFPIIKETLAESGLL